MENTQPENNQVNISIKKKSPLIPILIAILALLIVGGAVGGYLYYRHDQALNGPCGTAKVDAASAQMFKLIDRWNDAFKLASNTSRIGLAGPVGTLQSIKQDFNNSEMPACMDYAKKDLTLMMESTIDGFLAFQAQSSDSEVTAFFTKSKANLDTFYKDLATVKQCAPDCGK